MKICYIDFINPKKTTLALQSTAANYFAACGNNTGNIVHLEAYNTLFKPNYIFDHCALHDIDAINTYDLLFIKCANQLGSHFSISQESIEKIKQINIPIVVGCLGAQNQDADTLDILPQNSRILDFFKIINQKRYSSFPNISTRGLYSQKVLEYYGIESTVTGCITTMLYPDNIGNILKNKYRNKMINNISIAGNNPYNECYHWLERELIQIIEKYSGLYVAQSPELIISLVHGERVVVPDIIKTIFNTSEEEYIRRWFIRYGRVFYNTNSWSEAIKLYDIIIGTRYHGIAIAIQNSVIGTIFTIDSRTKELAETTGIKYIDVKQLKNKRSHEIVSESIWTDQDFDKLETNSALCKNSFHEFFANNNIVL